MEVSKAVVINTTLGLWSQLTLDITFSLWVSLCGWASESMYWTRNISWGVIYLPWTTFDSPSAVYVIMWISCVTLFSLHSFGEHRWSRMWLLSFLFVRGRPMLLESNKPVYHETENKLTKNMRVCEFDIISFKCLYSCQTLSDFIFQMKDCRCASCSIWQRN